VIAFRCTNAESREIDKSARDARMPRGDYIRMKVLGNAAGAAPAKTETPKRAGRHAARLGESGRMRDIYDALKSAGSCGLTGMELANMTHCLAISTAISQLRLSLEGEKIECRREGETENGSKIYRYVLTGLRS
jgi:hypothetical protein